ncbi:MAG: ATP-dependent sacrificial sulfur transferase LarE [Propioniciclava sp.]
MNVPDLDTTRFTSLPEEVQRDARAVALSLDGHERLGVAFSGGVDSALLLALAVAALGRAHVVALLAVSPSLARRELVSARATASEIGAELVEFTTHEDANPAYRANEADRCFHCKNEMFTVIDSDLMARLGLDAVAYGENADDAVREDRPGARAAAAHQVLRPLAAAGLTKSRVRALAQAMGISVAHKPAAPCLASRIPHGEVVTPEKLRQIEEAEDVLSALGFADCRVRHHGEIARIEVLAADIARFAEEAVKEQVVAGVRQAGFRFVTVDLSGLQSGAFTLQVVRARG